MYMISVSKALSILIKNRFELDVRTVELKEAVGNILAEDLISKITYHHFQYQLWTDMLLEYQI